MQKVPDKTVLKDTSKITVEDAPSFSGIVTRECKGNLWVDETFHPKIALAQSYAVDSFAFLGDCQADNTLQKVKRFLEDTLFSELKAKGGEYFEFSIESEQLRESILGLWKGREIQTEKEQSFRIQPDHHYDTKIDNLLPKGYLIKEVDETFWQQVMDGYYENTEFLTTRLLESWYTFEEFRERSLAFCMISGKRIVGVIVGTATFQQVIPIDIEVELLHRKNGIAYALSIQFVMGCMDRGLIPQWDCVESNAASYHLAKKIGFEESRTNTVYWFQI